MFFWYCFNVLLVVFLICGLLECPNLLSLWVFLELLTLGGVSFFFMHGFFANHYNSLFFYLVGASVSSFLMIVSVLGYPFLNFFLLVSVCVKLGIYPFSGWVYEVVTGSNWGVIWFFSGPLKISFFIIILGLGVLKELYIVVVVLVVLSFLAASFNFKNITRSWRHMWAHMMFSSSASLLAIAYFGNLDSSFLVYFCYLLWLSVATLFLTFNPLSTSVVVGLEVFLYFLLFVSLPGSLAMLYKFVVGLSLVGISVLFFFFWSIYSVVEQWYIVNMFLSLDKSRSGFGFLCWV